MRSTLTIFSNSSIIPPSFKFMELHALTLAARSYALLLLHITQTKRLWYAVYIILRRVSTLYESWL